MSLGRFSAVVAQARLACISEGRRLKTEKRLFWSRPLRSGLPPFVLRDRVPSPFPFFPAFETVHGPSLESSLAKGDSLPPFSLRPALVPLSHTRSTLVPPPRRSHASLHARYSPHPLVGSRLRTPNSRRSVPQGPHRKRKGGRIPPGKSPSPCRSLPPS